MRIGKLDYGDTTLHIYMHAYYSTFFSAFWHRFEKFSKADTEFEKVHAT